MLRKRIIPILLLQDGGLVKTIKFKKAVYVGDPINAVKIFNDKEVDEIIILDIGARRNGATPDLSKIKDIVSESFMPLTYGGGVTSLNQIESLMNVGIEKIALNYSTFHDPNLILNSVDNFGSSTIVGAMDVKKGLFGAQKVWLENGTMKTKFSPIEYALRLEDLGVGEILLTSIDLEGTMKGYNLELVHQVANAVEIPVVANGGAGCVEDLGKVINSGAAGAGAGSLFVFHGKLRGILINYPSQDELKEKVFSI